MAQNFQYFEFVFLEEKPTALRKTGEHNLTREAERQHGISPDRQIWFLRISSYSETVVLIFACNSFLRFYIISVLVHLIEKIMSMVTIKQS